MPAAVTEEAADAVFVVVAILTAVPAMRASAQPDQVLEEQQVHVLVTETLIGLEMGGCAHEKDIIFIQLHIIRHAAECRTFMGTMRTHLSGLPGKIT